jgi:hypothetical protein
MLRHVRAVADPHAYGRAAQFLQEVRIELLPRFDVRQNGKQILASW